LRSGCGGLGFELRPPVPKGLEWNALRLAILTLIQVAARPRLMVRPPEGLALSRPRSVLARHLALLNLQIEGENRSHPRASKREMDAYQRFADAEKAFPVPSNQFPVPPKIFPVRLRREFNQKGQSLQAVRATYQRRKHPESRKFPVFSLDNREIGRGE
jgi:hypothetical protein